MNSYTDRKSGVATRLKMLAPNRKPHPPRLPFPAGACDCHAHAFGPQSIYPCTPSFPYLPPDVSPQDYEEMLLERFPASLNLFCILGFPNSCKSDSVFAISSGEDDHGKGLFDGLEGLRCGLGRGWREPA